ncbi:hypothetical protein MAM1_0054d03551 [Mucor ambiguus]|uniref:Zn(2)-C6 fungal-type domain-containing protein n=1 Tax=Mucor ambiguus TaxID=91626 RepID=A0A0C9MLS0_9FUNG|nr:hypothetical protein MAM1_0054d03551 [Mucor ambiguus]
MSKTTDQPPKRVKVTLACTICRKKKVKCDGIQPTCSRCQSIGICCQYSDPPKKRGPPKGYVEVIENRAHRIESILGTTHQQPLHQKIQQQSYPHINQYYHSNDISITPTTNNNTNNSNHTTSVDTINKKQQLIKDPVNALLCLVAGAVDAVLQQEGAATQLGSNGMMYAFLMNTNVLHSQEQSKHISTVVWAENFFTHFNFMFPILSRPQFHYQLEHKELNPMLKLAVFLLGCRLNNNQQDVQQEKILYQQFNDLFASASYDDTMKADLSTVQAIVIMCWYTYLAGDMQNCHTLRHYLSVIIHQLKLDYESSNDKQDIYQTEMKRRAFWVSFVIDQWLASCTNGNTLISKQHNVKYPQLEDNQLFALSSSSLHQHHAHISYLSVESALQINSFTEMIRLVHIVSDICDGVKSQSVLESNLTGWLLQLPSYLDYGKLNEDASPSPIAKMYRILYYTVQIMLNKTRRHQLQGLSNSICTTAANTLVHISEQMLEQGQEKYLHNIFFLSLTLATSIHLDNTISNSKDNNAPDKINLCKSISLIKETNCSLLARADFERLLDHFLVDRCQIVLDFGYPSPTHSACLSPTASKSVKNGNNKRVYVEEPDEQQEQEKVLLASPPSSIPTTPDYSTITAADNYNTQQQHFDINDIFPIITDEQQQVVDTNTSNQTSWPAWVDFFDTIESSATCSPASYFTPTQSPSLPLNLKDEDAMSFDIFSDQQFFNTFPLI